MMAIHLVAVLFMGEWWECVMKDENWKKPQEVLNQAEQS